MIGFQVDSVWSSDLLKMNEKQQGGSKIATMSTAAGAAASSQPSKMEVAKMKFELVNFYLEFFQYPNIPKLTVFQNMTTPKNWIAMLQILEFLSYNVKVCS